MLQTQCYDSQVSRLKITDKQTNRQTDRLLYTWPPTRTSGKNTYTWAVQVDIVVLTLLMVNAYCYFEYEATTDSTHLPREDAPQSKKNWTVFSPAHPAASD